MARMLQQKKRRSLPKYKMQSMGNGEKRRGRSKIIRSMDLIFHLICTFNLWWNWARGIQLTTSIYKQLNSISFLNSLVLFHCPLSSLCVQTLLRITQSVYESFFALFEFKIIISIRMANGKHYWSGYIKYAMILPLLYYAPSIHRKIMRR